MFQPGNRTMSFQLGGAVVLALSIAGCGGGNHSKAARKHTAPGFHFALSPVNLSVPAGATASVTVTLTRAGGFLDAVDLSLSPAVGGVTTSGTIPAKAGMGTLLVQVEASVAPQSLSNLQVVGTAGTLIQKAPFTLTVTAALLPGQLRTDLVQAPGGRQTSATWTNQSVIQEPVKAGVAMDTGATTQTRHGFDPRGVSRP
jgi:hypothetical protein